MLRLGTVFSGIGAIEHALDRMNIEHEIVFACDNGDVDILTKKIDPILSEINKELIDLGEMSQRIVVANEDDQTYKDSIDLMLDATKEEYERIKQRLEDVRDENMVDNVKSILNEVISMKGVKAARTKEYGKFLKDLCCKDTEKQTYLCYSTILEITNDFKKDNELSLLGEDEIEFESSDGIKWGAISRPLKDVYEEFERNNGKRIIRAMKDLCDRTSMLHEKINSFYILKELAQIEDYKEKKKYVDNLYKGCESKNKVRKSYMANYKGVTDENFHWNVAFLDGKQYQGQIDLFVGGSPCQSFSLVGKQRGLEDTRGTLFYEYARLIKEIQPKVFIYENVKAILSNDDGKTWKKMKEVFSDLGYDVNYTFNGKPSVLNAKDYGIPQNRERMFVVGFRRDLKLSEKFKFPEPIKLEKKMQDFLLDNVSGAYYLPKKGVDFVTSEKNLTKKFTQIDGEIALCQKKNHQFKWHGDFVFVEENKDMEKTMEDLEKYFLSEKVEKYVMATGTKNFYSRPKTDLEVARPLLTTMHKMHRAGVDNYVHTNGRLRKLTPRECLRLMGFCDSFKIVVSDTAMYQQAGNSIVVDVLIHLMNSIIKSYPELI